MFDKIVEARMEEIFELVRENIGQAGYKYQLPAGVIITGGSSQLPGLTKLAKKVFGMPARIGQPRGLNGLIEGITVPAFAVSFGLILEGMSEDDYHSLRNRPLGGGDKGGMNIFGRLRGFIKNMMP
jgi:cell division protein FtsA